MCRSYRKEHPDVDFHFRTMELANIQKALNENEIDVGLSIYQDGIQGAKFCYRRLYEDRYMLAVPVGHRLAKRASVSIADLRGERVVVPHFNRSKSMLEQMHVKLRNAGAEVRPAGFEDVGAMMATLVTAGAVAIALDHLRVFGNGNVEFVPLAGENMEICAGAVWKRSKETGAITSFVDFLEQACEGFGKEDFLARSGPDALPSLRLPPASPRASFSGGPGRP